VSASEPLWPRGNPLRLAATSLPWRAGLLMVSYFAVGTALFTVTLVAGVASVGLLVTAAGIPLLVAVAWLVRAAARVERWRVRLITGEFIDSAYLPVSVGLIATLRTRWTDPATWAHLGYLVALYPLLFVLDVVAFTLWFGLVGAVTVPIWYRFSGTTFPNGESGDGIALGYFPNGPDGAGAVGLWIGDLATALTTAAVSLVLLLLVGNSLVVAAARLHTRIARRLLGPPVDPLAAAKAMLASPGPLV